MVRNNRTAYAKTLGDVSLDIWESLSRDVNTFNEVEHNFPTTSGALRRKVGEYSSEGYSALISVKYQNINAGKVVRGGQMAFIKSDYEINPNTYMEIVHVWKDMTVLPEMSERFLRETHCSLHLIDTDHAIEEVMEYIRYLFEAFLKRF